MKKVLALLLVCALSVFVLAGCAQSGSKTISEKEAREIALKEVDGAKDENISACDLNEQDKKYEITILADGLDSKIEVSSVDGSVLRRESETVTAGNVSEDNGKAADMGKEAIKKIALGVVDGAVDSEITDCVILKKDDGSYMYQVVLVHDNKSHSLQIDAKTGEITLHDEKQN